MRYAAQHPDMNQMNYKICSEMQQQVYLRKVCKMNGPTLWAGWHDFDLCVISNATVEWCKRLQVCVHVKGRLSEYLILLQIIHVYFNVLVWQKLEVRWFYCVKYTKILLFLSFYISQGRVATYAKCGGKRVSVICKFLAESSSERIVKTGQHLPKLCQDYRGITFWLTL